MDGHGDGDPLHPLTPREREVLELLRLGLTNGEIAGRLEITLDGAKYHVSEIIGKLGVRDRHEAASYQERRSGWATALAPIAFLWRQAGALVPVKASSVALVASAGAGAAALGGIGLIVFFLMQGGGGAVEAGEYKLEQTFLNPTPEESDYMGMSVAAVGGNVLVGAYQDDASALDAGIAYLFDGGTGALLQTFLNPNPSENDQFGWSVAGVGDTVLVGARLAGSGETYYSGAAYLFDGGTGTLLQTFVNPKLSFDDKFGSSVAGVGDNALVGAPGEFTTAPLNVGAAYLFDGATGALLQTFVNLTPAAGTLFGTSVAAVGDDVLVGAPQGLCPSEERNVRFAIVCDGPEVTDAGAAYLFDGSTGAVLQTFISPNPSETDRFGFSVAAVGGNVLVGAHSDDPGATDAGAAYLFDGSTGALLQTFVSPNPGENDRFGFSVAAVGDNVLVGAPEDSTGERAAGAAYLFDVATGALLQSFLKPTPASGDYFGWSLAVAGSDVIVSAPQDDTGADLTGAAYLFGVVGSR